jgi:CDP-glycerol glycerophosphotransferase
MPSLEILAQFLRCLGMAALSYIVPKKSGLLVFYSTFAKGGYTGNLRPVFELLERDHPEVQCLWLTNSAKLQRELKQRGFHARLYGRYPAWSILRAECLVLDRFAQNLSFGRFRIFQLWHGMGFKCVGLLNRQRTGLSRFLRRCHYRKYAFILASSERDRLRKMESFRSDNVFVIGSPRNDVLFEDPTIMNSIRLPAAFDRLIAYCPTFREGGGPLPFSGAFWPKLQELLEQRNAAFLLKRHPKDQISEVPRGFPNIIDVTDAVDDVQQLLLSTDILISDYSSIVTDFALTGRPIIFYIYDLAEYAASGRSLYFDLNEVLPGPFVRTEQELLARLSDLSWFEEPAYQARYAAFRTMFNEFLDANSTVRTVNRLLELR